MLHVKAVEFLFYVMLSAACYRRFTGLGMPFTGVAGIGCAMSNGWRSGFAAISPAGTDSARCYFLSEIKTSSRSLGGAVSATKSLIKDLLLKGRTVTPPSANRAVQA